MKVFRFFLILLILNFNAKAQVIINEIMASNSSTIVDVSGSHSDWVELYNPSNQTIDLNGYFVSDNPDNLNKFKLNSSIGSFKISPKSFLIIWCSGIISNGATHTSFSLAAEKESFIITKPDGKTIVDRIDFENQRTDIAFGKYIDGQGENKYLKKASPLTSNNSSGYYLGVMSPPVFSKTGGFFKESIEVALSQSEPGAKIYYTLDGSNPLSTNLAGKKYRYKNQYTIGNAPNEGVFIEKTIKTNEYITPLKLKNRNLEPNNISNISSTWDFNPKYIPDYIIPKANVLKAIVTKPGYLDSEITSHTFFIDNQNKNNHKLPITAVSVQEDFLFDYDSGIYTAGKMYDKFTSEFPDKENDFCTPGNFSQSGSQWERSGSFEYFVNNTQKISQGVNIRINGACSRALPEKSLRIYGKREFDNYPIFSSNPNLLYNKLIIRNSGNDFQSTMFRDCLGQELVNHFNFSSQQTQPSVLYLNGEYWGLFAIRERLDAEYLKIKYNSTDVDIRKVVWTSEDEIEAGDGKHFDEMLSFLRNNDLSNTSNYEKAISYLDPESLIDYQIAEIFLGNVDWPQNNIRMWRNRSEIYAPYATYGLDGRWRYLLYDVDKSLGLIINAEHDGLKRALEAEENYIFKYFLKNESFKKAFISRYLDELNSTFLLKHSRTIFQKYIDNYRPEVINHIARWKNMNSISTWEAECQVVKNFLVDRPYWNLNFLKANFNLNKQYELTVSTNDTLAGLVKVNTIIISNSTPGVYLNDKLQWSGNYFSELPVTLKAQPKAGYKFKHWSFNGTTLLDTNIVLLTSSNVKYEAIFEQENHPNKDNIPAASLADCSLSILEWSSISAAGTSPLNTKFVFFNQKEPKKEATIAGFTKGTFDNDSKSRISGLDQKGISFVNSGGPNENTGYPHTQIGGLLMAINTIGLDSAYLSYTVSTLTPGERKYGLTLQYRIGETGNFNDFTPLLDYKGAKEVGGELKYNKIIIPNELINQSYVQLFWRYYYTGQGSSGARDELRLDDIVFSVKKKAEILELNKISNYEPNNLVGLHPNFLNDKPLNYSITKENYINSKPSPPIIQSEKKEVCGTEKIKLLASGCINGTVFWSTGETGKNISVGKGKYFAYCASSCGISENSSTQEIKRVEILKAPAVFSDKYKVCEGEYATLNVEACNGKVIWNNTIEKNTLLVQVSSNATYSAVCFANGCKSEISKSLELKIEKPNIPEIEKQVNDVCLGESVFLTAKNCDGLVVWDNNYAGMQFKYTPTVAETKNYKARCKSKDGQCFSDWSKNTKVVSHKIPNAPKALVEYFNKCDTTTANLFETLLEPISSDEGDITFHFKNNSNNSIFPQPKFAPTGDYFLFKTSKAGCVSASSIVKVKKIECGNASINIYNQKLPNIVLDLSADKKTYEVGEKAVFSLTVSNVGKSKGNNILIQGTQNNKLIYDFIGSSFKPDKNAIKLEINSLDVGQRKSYTFEAIVNSPAPILSTLCLLKTDEPVLDLINKEASVKINDLNENCNVGIGLINDNIVEKSKDIFEVTTKIFISNTGTKSLERVQLKLDLGSTFGNGATLTHIKNTTSKASFFLNPNYNGYGAASQLLIDSLSSIKPNSFDTLTVRYTVNVSAAKTKKFYLNAALLKNQKILDVSTEGINVDPDNDLDPTNNSEPTFIFLNRIKEDELAVAFSIIDSVKVSANTQEYTFMALIENKGTSTLNNLVLHTDLSKVFGNKVTFENLGKIAASKNSKFNINSNFNGKSDVNLLNTSLPNILDPSKIDTIIFSIRLNHYQNLGPYFINVYARAKGPNNIVLTDTSNSGKVIKKLISDPTVILIPSDFKNLVKINEGFSPNSDNINDNLEIEFPAGIYLQDMYIYNKFGKKIKEFNETSVINNKLKWESSDLPADIINGTYYYSLRLKNNPVPILNFITIQR